MTAFPVPAAWARRPSPHHNARPAGARVSAIVLHSDASGSEANTLSWLANPESKVSYHVLVGRLGEVFAVVAPERRAWHAGVSSLDNVADCNNYSVGVCLSNRNTGREAYPGVQVSAAADVCARLCAHFGIPVGRIVTHAAVALPAGRKNDPLGLDVPAFRAMVEARLNLAPLGGA